MFALSGTVPKSGHIILALLVGALGLLATGAGQWGPCRLKTLLLTKGRGQEIPALAFLATVWSHADFGVAKLVSRCTRCRTSSATPEKALLEEV